MCGWQVKLRDLIVTHGLHLRDKGLIIKRYINSYVYVYFLWNNFERNMAYCSCGGSYGPEKSSNISPRCMECRRGLAMRNLSVRPSVCLSVCQTRGL